MALIEAGNPEEMLGALIERECFLCGKAIHEHLIQK